MSKVRKKDASQKLNIPFRKSKNISCIHCHRTFYIKDTCRIEGPHIPLLRCCGHTICDKCSEDSTLTSCPECDDNSTSQIPSINFYAVGLMLAQNSRPAGIPSIGDDEFVFTKSIQSKIDRSSQYCIECKEAASFKCLGCNQLYCDECFKKIHSCYILRDHEKVSLNRTEYMPPQLATVCKDHTPNTSIYWCTECSVKCCSDCIIHEHRTHSTLKIHEMNKLCQDDFTAAYEDLAHIIGQVCNTKEEVDAALKFPEDEYNSDKVESEINQHFLYLHGILQNLESQMIEILHAQIKGRSRNLIEIQEELQSLKTELQDGILLATLAKRKSESVNHMEIIKQLKELTNVRCYLLKRQVNDDDKKTIEFHTDESVVEAIRNHCVVKTKPSPKLYSLVAGNELPNDYVIKTVARESLSIPSLNAPPPQPSNQSSAEDPTTENGAESVSSNSPIDIEMESPKEYQVHVVYIRHPHCFYVRKKSDDHLYKQVERELKKYDAKSDMFPEEVKVGEIYVIRGIRHNWYRGRVESFSTTNSYHPSGVYSTLAIDEGFIHKVEKSKIRRLSSKLIDIPPLVTKHKLFDIYPINGTSWSRESIEEMGKIVKIANEELPRLYKVGDNGRGVDLLIPTSVRNDALSVRDTLVFLGFGKFECTEKLLTLKPSASNVYHHELLELNTSYEVVCLNVESPKCFYVRNAKSNEDYFQKLIADMTNIYKSTKKVKSLVYNPVIGLNCAALHNGSWHRGVISDIPGVKKIEVFFVDLGIKSIISYDKIRRLDPRYTPGSTRAIKLRLQDAEDLREHPNMKRMMVEFMDPTAKIIISEKKDDFYIASVFNRHGISLKDVLNPDQNVRVEIPLSPTGKSSQDSPTKTKCKFITKRKGNKRNLYLPQLCMDSYLNTIEGKTDVKPEPEQNPYLCHVNVIHVVSPDEIYIATTDRAKTLNEIYDRMQNFYSKQKSKGSPDMSVGAMCAVRSPQNNAYYRAEIVAISEGKVKVFCIDEGKYENIPENCIQSLAPELHAIPVFLSKVRLGGIFPTCGKSTWTSVSCEKLVEIINRNETRNFFIAKVEESKEKPMTVDLYVEEVNIPNPIAPSVIEKKLINRMLVEEGLAMPIKGYNDTKLKVLAADVKKEMNFHDENLVDQSCDNICDNTDTPPISEDFIDPGEDMSQYFPPGIPTWLPAESIRENSFSAIITYLDWDASVYLHSVDQIDALHEIDEKLRDNYANREICETDEWSPGDMCIVKFHGALKWCRGVVHQVREKYVSVEFIDYGNFEWQERETLYKELMLEDVPRVASKCQIYGLISTSPNTKWDKWALHIIHTTIVEKKCKVTILRRNQGINIIKVNSVDNLDRDLIAYLLYDKKLNICLEGISLDMTSDVDSNSGANIDAEFDENVENDEDSVNSVAEGAVDDATHRTVEYDIEMNNYLENSIKCLGTVRSINVSSDDDGVVETTVGKIIKKVLTSDEYPIIAESSDQSETKSDTNGDADDSYSDIDEEYFETNGKICQASLPDEYRLLFADFQLPKNDGKYTPLILPANITEFEGAMGGIDVYQSNIVWLHPSTTTNCSILSYYRTAYVKLQIAMGAEVDEQPYLENIDPGTPCCAQYEGIWYRGCIVSDLILDGMIEVLFVDWGNVSLVEVNQIHVMKKEWFDLPTLAIKCRLWNTRIADNVRARNWLQFKRDKCEKMFRIVVVGCELDQLIVKIFEKDMGERLMYQDLIDRKIFSSNPSEFYSGRV